MDGIHEGETDGARLARMGTDAAAWAREMAQTAADVAVAAVTMPGGPSTSAQALSALLLDGKPGAWLHGWLCAALEAGRAAGYSQGRQDATDRLHAVVGPWPIAQASEALRAIAWPLPEDSAGRTQPEDPAARDLPADLAGKDEASPIGRAADALEQIAETLRSVVRPLNGGAAVRVTRS